MTDRASVREIEAAAHLASGYVHVPFCARVCPYCDFTVVAGRDDLVDRYVRALVLDIAATPAWRPLDAVFVGGGTPSRLGAARLRIVLDALAEHHGIAPGAEITLEANPEDIDAATAAELVTAGFTRISLGVQSFDDQVLADLGRLHDRARALQSTEAAMAAGFDSVSLDLIFGSPVEDGVSWQQSLRTAVDLAPHHVSTYSLTVEPGTVLWKQVRRGAPAPDGDVQADRWEVAEALLGEAGYVRYEISNHARPGHYCRYNAAVWGHADYLAFGPGAHGFRQGMRTVNVRRLDTYLDRMERGIGPVQSVEPVDGWGREQERLLVGLRRAGGVVAGEGGTALLATEDGRRLVEHGVLALVDGRLVVTRPLLTDAVLRAVLGTSEP